MNVRMAVLAAFAAAPTAVAQQERYLMLVNSASDRVMLFSAADGSMVDSGFIVDANGSPYDFNLPKEAIQVGDEIWVSDQNSDRVFRFDLAGGYVGTVGPAGLDNLRGLEFYEGVVYVCNAGTGNGAPGSALVRISPDGQILGSFPVGDQPYDVVAHNGELIVSVYTSDDLMRYTPAGAPLGAFHDSDGLGGIDAPQQVTRLSNGNLIAAGFDPPIGLFEYDPSGAEVGRLAIGQGNRGAWELENGNLLFTDTAGVHVYDVASQTVQGVATGFTAQHIGLLVIGDEPPACYADCTSDGSLTPADFSCFRALFLAGDAAADCDGSGGLTPADFSCFRDAFLAGCG